MFPRRERLTDKRIFTALFQKGEWVKGQTFSLRILKADTAGAIGFIVSRKVAKSAVDRNQTKRRLRAIFRQLLHSSDFQGLMKQRYLLVIVHRPAAAIAYDDLCREAKGLLARVRARPES